MTFRTATKLSEALKAAADDLEASITAKEPKTVAKMDRWLTWRHPTGIRGGKPGDEAAEFSAGICTTCLVGGILLREYNALEQLAKAARWFMQTNTPPEDEADVSFSVRCALGDDHRDDGTVAKLMSIEDARKGHWWTAILMGKWHFDGDPDEVRANVHPIREPRPMLSGTMQPEEARRLIDDIRTRAVPELQAAGA